LTRSMYSRTCEVRPLATGSGSGFFSSSDRESGALTTVAAAGLSESSLVPNAVARKPTPPSPTDTQGRIGFSIANPAAAPSTASASRCSGVGSARGGSPEGGSICRPIVIGG